MSTCRRRTLRAAAIALAAVLALMPAAYAAEDPAATAAAALAVQPVYVSPEAGAYGVAATVADGTGLPDTVRIAVLTDGNAGQLAADVSERLGANGTTPLTVGVVIVHASSIVAFDAVSTAGYCKGGADLAARNALDDLPQLGHSPAVAKLLTSYPAQLAKLPPDKGESSCASALAHHDSHPARAWLWWLFGAVVGVLGVGALALYSRRVAAARRAAGEVEEPASDELPDWIAEGEGEGKAEGEGEGGAAARDEEDADDEAAAADEQR